MTKQYVFESQVNDECIFEHIESAFDLPSRHAAQIHCENWGVMVHIMWGRYEGWYDVVHAGNGKNNRFICA